MNSIEVAHAYFRKNPTHFTQETIHILKESIRVYRELGFSHKENSTCILLDDQRGDWDRSAYMSYVEIVNLAIPIHYVCFETDLAIYTEAWLSTQKNAESVRKTIKFKYNGTPQCSHYIAIWYLLRLGLLSDDQNVIIPYSQTDLPFQSERIISILAQFNQAYEDQSDRELLSKSNFNLSDKITRYYFADYIKESYGL